MSRHIKNISTSGHWHEHTMLAQSDLTCICVLHSESRQQELTTRKDNKQLKRGWAPAGDGPESRLKFL